ncbi:hypothetical protein EN907_30065 [Mesorhizobium sp. M7A.F.Ca.CA.004.06.2.1]|nr:hypothetical protein EN907_30065 [Mesorhizobium sp. M7A.F.Ca.CA.004.06.2.1]
MGRLDVTTAFAPSLPSTRKALKPKLPISPLEGEMSGRTEGGAVPPASKGLPYGDTLHATTASSALSADHRQLFSNKPAFVGRI